MKNLFAIIVGLLFVSCSKTKEITIKDETGAVIEHYEINDDSLKHGMYMGYVNGTLYERAFYKKGKLHGERTILHANGQIEIKENYDQDIIHGSYTSYHENGQVDQEGQYIQGQMQGILKTYYPNGTLKETVTVKDNEENGSFKEYYENGTLKWEGQYLNGDNEFGPLSHYNEEGVLVKKMICDSLGVCATTWTLEDGDIAPKTN